MACKRSGFESPKLHIFAGQKHISIIEMIFDLLNCKQAHDPRALAPIMGIFAAQYGSCSS